MSIRKAGHTLLAIGIIMSLFAASGYSVTNQKQADQEAPRLIIPPEVKTVLEQGKQAREARLDIPFTIDKYLFLPAQTILHSVFIFSVKNEHLGFQSQSWNLGGDSIQIETDEETGEEEGKEDKQEQTQDAFSPFAAKMQAKAHIFIQFNKLTEDGLGEMVKELYVPFDVQTDSSNYDPSQVDWYSVGYPLPAGKYLLSMAISSETLDKIGTQYYEFTLPDPMTYTKDLGTTSIFFAENIKQVSAPEQVVFVHKGFFTYSVLEITPNLEQAFAPGKNIEVFFFIFGARPNQAGQFDIEVKFAVKNDDAVVINYAPQQYTNPLVIQQLPLTRTVKITSTDEEGKITERREKENLDPGNYTLSILIKDKNSGKSVEKAVELAIK